MRGQIPAVFGEMARYLPLMPAEMAIRLVTDRAMAINPSLALRLTEHAGATFAIDPVDCPFVVLLTLGADRLQVRLMRDGARIHCDTRIAAPLLVLLGLIDGTYDGDALFFSRDLTIEGNVEALLALRNAIENTELDPAALLALPAEFRIVFNRIIEAVLGLLRRVLGAPGSGNLPGGVLPE